MHQMGRNRRGILIAGVFAAGLLGVAAQKAGAQEPAAEQTPANVDNTQVNLKQLDALKKRFAALPTARSQPGEVAVPTKNLKSIMLADASPAPAPSASGTPDAGAPAPAGTPDGTPVPDPQAAAPATPDAQAPAAPAAPPPVDLDTPFAYADFTWMLSNPRNHDEVLDGKYFSGEFRVDTNYMYDYNHPIDHTLDETTEGERTGEFIIQALGAGGDFHAGNMMGRILTQFGAVSTAVPRNDASYSLGQWQLNDAYRYLTEMYGGWHINYKHGLNIQVGDFLSFIGLFSYYSFDNWTYQPSYVSSNTPWFFTGMRAQFFPTNKLKIEPWLINGWQSYAKYNGREAVGGQILWRPTGSWDVVFNTYALGRDTLGNPYRSRYHADWSQEYKFFEHPNSFITRAAMTSTEDFGCETGGGVVCTHGNINGRPPAQNFVGIMDYFRLWFGDKFAFSWGGGVLSNPGRYLALLPPIDGATATSGTPYFLEAPGLPLKAYDFQLSFDYMPSQWVTWKVEFTQRGSQNPVFVGPGGVTPPGGNNGSPGTYACNDGTATSATSLVKGLCSNDGGVWFPDLVKQERRWIFALMVKL
jgi:hypothetical protein